MNQISEHFSLEELTRSEIGSRLGIDNTPTPEIIENLKRLATNILEPIRGMIGHAVNINSAYRSPAVNKAVGSTSRSQHLTGCAADITIKGMKPREICQAIINSGIEFDQLILEFDAPPGSGWVHISQSNNPNTPPRFSKLIIDNKGIRNLV